VGNWNVSPGTNPQVNGTVGAFTVTDAAGTTYFFDGAGAYDSGSQLNWEYPYQIEDRNGNLIVTGISGMTGLFYDTLKRPLLNGNTIGGLVYPLAKCPAGTCPSSTTVNYTVSLPGCSISPCSGKTQFVGSLDSGDTSAAGPVYSMTVSGNQPAWSGFALPTSTSTNPQQYTF
jgi:hypothetical protein